MDEHYLGQEEIGSIIELFLCVLFMCFGIFAIQMHIKLLDSKTQLMDTFDKVSADVQYEQVANDVFKFTPYQAYMFGYHMDNWGPDTLNSLLYVDDSRWVSNQGWCELSPSIYEGNLVQRNNMISGANQTSLSVRGVLDDIKDDYARSLSLTEFWRGQSSSPIMIEMKWTDNYSATTEEFSDDGFTVLERRKLYKWVMHDVQVTSVTLP